MTIPREHQADRAFARSLANAAPAEAAAFAAFNSAVVGRSDGAIPRKYRELIALGVALTTQCKYCLASHASELKKLGATMDEVAETVFVASALRAGAAYTHGLVAMRYFAEATEAPAQPHEHASEHLHTH